MIFSCTDTRRQQQRKWLFNRPLLHQKLDNDLKLLKEAKQQQAKTTSETTPSAELYKIQDTFATKDQYWIVDDSK